MVLIFGRKICSACQEAKRILEGDGIEFKYYDMDNLDEDGLSKAAYYGLLEEGTVLPFVVDEETDEIVDVDIGEYL